MKIRGFYLHPFLLGLLICLGLLWPLGAVAYFYHQYDPQVMRIYEMSRCLQDLQIPCRWVPDLGGLYGFPLFNYIAPLPYFAGALIFFVSASLSLSLKAILSAAYVGTYLSMYLFGRKIWGEKGAASCAVLYTLSTFLVIKANMEPVGQLWAFMLLPAVLWIILILKKIPNVLHLLLLAFLVVSLITSWSASLLLLSLASIVICWLFLRKPDLRFFKFATAAVLLGLMLSAFYWLPMMAEQNLIHPSSEPKQPDKRASTVNFLPVSAQEAPVHTEYPRFAVLVGVVDISRYREGTDWFSFTADVKSHTIVRLSKLYFPEWKILNRGREINFEYQNNSLGLMTLILGPGRYEITGRLENTPLRFVANSVSVLGFLAAIFLILTQIPQTRRGIFYYLRGIYR